jgi:predicted nucleic acid-binding Zn ribbon protein
MFAMARSPQPLGKVLNQLIDTMGARSRIDAARIVETWAVVAGHSINAVTRSAHVEKRKLIIRITSPTWRNELHMARRAWRDRLNEELGQALVDEIVFV